MGMNKKWNMKVFELHEQEQAQQNTNNNSSNNQSQTTDDPEIIITIRKESGEPFTESDEISLIPIDGENSPLIALDDDSNGLVYNQPIHIKNSDIISTYDWFAVYVTYLDNVSGNWMDIQTDYYDIETNKNTNVEIVIPNYVTVTANVTDDGNAVTGLTLRLDTGSSGEILDSQDRITRMGSYFTENNGVYTSITPKCQYTDIYIDTPIIDMPGTAFWSVQSINGYSPHTAETFELLNIKENTTFNLEVKQLTVEEGPGVIK